MILKHDVNLKLSNNCEYYRDIIHVSNGKLLVSEPIHNTDGVFTTILDDKGKILYGKYSDRELINIPLVNGETRKVYANNKGYYIHDICTEIIDETNSDTYKVIIRSLVGQSVLDANYAVVRKVKYLCAIFLLAGCTFAMYITVKSIQKPLDKISEMANQISQSEDLSQHIELNDHVLDEIKALANAHNSMLIRAQELLEVQKQFSSDVAHELKTPVSVVIAECQFSSKYLTEDEEVRKAFAVIEEQARKTNQIINNLLELTRLEKNQFKMDYQYLDLSEIIHSACDLESMMDRKNIKIHKEIEKCYANVDLNFMLMAIRNIVNNAMKYSEENSEISVRTITFADKILIQCEDHGCGMDEETKKHVFDRFYRADSSRNSEGLGLGMAITKEIIELHKGVIHIDSKLGKGCIITIEIPV